jgi:hypothetical protein
MNKLSASHQRDAVRKFTCISIRCLRQKLTIWNVQYLLSRILWPVPFRDSDIQLGREIGPQQSLCLHRKTKYRKTRNWIRADQDCSSHTQRKGKVKWSRYTPWRRMGWKEVQLLLILSLGTRWGWVVSIMPWPRFTPGERTRCTGGWVGPRAGLDASRKILCLCRGSNPDRPARSQTLYCLSYSAPRS